MNITLGKHNSFNTIDIVWTKSNLSFDTGAQEHLDHKVENFFECWVGANSPQVLTCT